MLISQKTEAHLLTSVSGLFKKKFISFVICCISIKFAPTIILRGGAVVARWAHNPKVGGSNPPSATSQKPCCESNRAFLFSAQSPLARRRDGNKKAEAVHSTAWLFFVKHPSEDHATSRERNPPFFYPQTPQGGLKIASLPALQGFFSRLFGRDLRFASICYAPQNGS